MEVFKFFPEGWKEDVFFSECDIKQGFVESCDENMNLYVRFNDKQLGVIPREEIEGINLQQNGLPKKSLCEGKVNKFVQFKIIGNDGEKFILSRKKVQNEVLDIIKADLKPGQIVRGIVKNITSYGAFVDIGGGVVGLVYIEDLSVARMKNPFERVKIGQNINVMIKCINRNTGKINLSYKEFFGSWEDNAKKFKVGMKTTGIIRETEKNQNGIFIELTPNLVGMVEYEEGLSYGSNVDVLIKKIDYDKKKVKLVLV